MKFSARYLFTRALVWLWSALLAFAPLASAQNYASAPYQVYFAQQELDQMLAPIALYPDSLLSQILMAATYPVEVIEAARWSRDNPGLSGDHAVRSVERMDWDPSVKSLVAFPQILALMAEKSIWMQRLGDAFLSQESQVMETVQNLRLKAYAAGNLRSTEKIRVVMQPQVIVVEPVNPEIIYVPYYDPTLVYGSWWWPAHPPVHWAPWPGSHPRPGWSAGFAWGPGIVVSAGFFFGGFDWHHRRVNIVRVNNYYYNNSSHRPNFRRDARQVHAAPGPWRHDPTHRRGVSYREPRLNREFVGVTRSQTPREPGGRVASPASNSRNQSRDALYPGAGRAGGAVTHAPRRDWDEGGNHARNDSIHRSDSRSGSRSDERGVGPARNPHRGDRGGRSEMAPQRIAPAVQPRAENTGPRSRAADAAPRPARAQSNVPRSQHSEARGGGFRGRSP